MSTNEEQLAMGLAITCLCITVCATLVAVFALIFGIIDSSITELVVGFVMGGTAGAAGWGTVRLLDRVNSTWDVESVLTYRQKRDLRRARGALVMEKALIEVENERDNITHRALEAANDPDKPPHETQWSSRDRYNSPTLARSRYDDRGYRS